MTQKEIEQLANLIVDKIAEKQKQLDSDFIENLKNSGADVEVHIANSNIEKLELEVFRLGSFLEHLEKNEEYEAAAKCRNEIQSLIEKIDELRNQTQ